MWRNVTANCIEPSQLLADLGSMLRLFFTEDHLILDCDFSKAAKSTPIDCRGGRCSKEADRPAAARDRAAFCRRLAVAPGCRESSSNPAWRPTLCDRSSAARTAPDR